MMSEPMKKRYDALGPVVVAALKKRHFNAVYCESLEAARAYVISGIPRGHVVSWGGSVTLQQLALQESVRKAGYAVIDRDTGETPEARQALMREALGCDTFLMSANAISEDGVLVNIDGNGNRVAALIFGPKQVFVIAGMNKVVRRAEDAFERARSLAAPANAQRFPDITTPCASTGACYNCMQRDSICAQMVITRLCRPAGRIHVVLVGAHLGL